MLVAPSLAAATLIRIGPTLARVPAWGAALAVTTATLVLSVARLAGEQRCIEPAGAAETARPGL